MVLVVLYAPTMVKERITIIIHHVDCGFGFLHRGNEQLKNITKWSFSLAKTNFENNSDKVDGQEIVACVSGSLEIIIDLIR
jgi:hypothetical protein